jgi:WD40 repeat protein
MLEERLDYSNERQRHKRFVGRAALLERLDQALASDGWVVVTGGPGMGKSALLAAWLSRREAAGAVVPHHFIRRGEYDWDDPAKLVGSLVAQLEARFPELREAAADARMHPASRLAAVVARVSARELVPCGERLVVLIDALDEYDPPAGAAAGDPLAAFLPHALPDGVSFLFASRPKHPYVQMLEARDGELVRIDLDEPEAAADNEATVRALWAEAAPRLGLSARFVEEAVARAGGNLQHATTLRKHLAALPPEQRRIEDIPRGLAALLEKAWQRIATEPAVVVGLGLLCAAREALTLDELGAVAGWAGAAQRHAFVRGARELLVETERPDGQAEYRLHHESIRAHIAKVLGPAALRGHHGAIARGLAAWPAAVEPAARRYTLRHALIHRVEAGDWAAAWRLAADTRFLEAKCRELGAHEAEADVARAAERCRAGGGGDPALRRRLGDLARALARESHWLRAAPEATAALVWNRLRRWGWSAAELDAELQLSDEERASFLRVRHATTRQSPALVRDLVGHTGPVNACAVTPDGRRVISAADDGTLRVWDLESGRVLATMHGHTAAVRACAVTADGRRAISGSADRTLRVWDLESGRVLATLEGHTCTVLACVVTSDGRVISSAEDGTLKVWDLDRGDVLATLEGQVGGGNALAVTADARRVIFASSFEMLQVWDLESGRVLARLAGHTGAVHACAVTTDGRRAISASWDTTLKLWDLEHGSVLATLEGHTGWVNACAVTADGRRAVSASCDGTLKVWDLDSGSVLSSLEGHGSWVSSCAMTADGRRLVSASRDRTLKVWDLESDASLSAPEGHSVWVTECAVTPDGRRAVSASADRTLKVWDLDNGRALVTLDGHQRRVNACAVTVDGQRVVSASDDRTLKVWDLESGRVLATLEGHTGWVNACFVTADGQRVVSASNDRTLKVWDLESGRVLLTVADHVHTKWITAWAVVTSDGRVLSASDNGTLRIWDLESGRVFTTLKGLWHLVIACVVAPDGRRAVSASPDRTVKIWNLESGHMLASLEGHTGRVNACTMTPDGRRIISASADRTLKVWDLDTRACLFTHRGDVTYTAVAATATAIIAGDVVGDVCILDWPLPCSAALPSSTGTADSPGRQPGLRLDGELAQPRLPRQKHTILFLAANPSDTDRLALDREARAIEAELERGGCRDGFELVTRWAAEPLDLLRELRRLRPTVVHFSGHGGHGGHGSPASAGEHRPGPGPGQALYRSAFGEGAAELSGEAGSGLIFDSPDGRAQLVSTAALEAAFGAAGASVRLVVLSACYSEAQAEALLSHVDCVVGMGGAIHDDAARSFAIGFYGGLGERESIAAAYEQGRAAISLEGLPDAERPRLKVRDGVDASQLVLAVTPR